MSSPSPDPVILGYIRANRALYAREAIERELASSGHTPEAIAAAWAAVEAEDHPAVALAAPPEVADEPAAAPRADAPDDVRDPAIASYIRANRAIYNRDAVTAALIESGHTAADIEAAWAEVLAADAQPVPAQVVAARATRRAVLNSWRFWVTVVVAFFVLVSVPPILSAAFPNEPIGVGVGAVLVIGYIAAALIMLGTGKARDVAYGLLWAIGAIIGLTLFFALLGFILLVIILGICLVALGRSGISP